MKPTTKQRIATIAYRLLALPPLLYTAAFTGFLYYTGNGYGQPLTYHSNPEKTAAYHTWFLVILELENWWIAAFAAWFILLLVTAIWWHTVSTKRLVIFTTLLYTLPCTLISSLHTAGTSGWLDTDMEKLATARNC